MKRKINTRLLCTVVAMLFVDMAKAEDPYNIIWSRQFGSTESETGQQVAIDAVGNAYISGQTYGSLAGPNAGFADAFLTKYDTSGNLLWSRQVGTASEDVSLSVAVDAAGNPFISGYTAGNIGGPNAGQHDAFLSKFDSSGNLIWSRQIGTSTFENSWDLAVDPLGNAYLSGNTSGSLAGPNAGAQDSFLTKYDSSGNLLWSRQIGSTDNDFTRGVAVDSFGNAYISGQTRGNFAGPNAGGDDAVLTKYDSAGNLLWSRQIGAASDDQSLSVAVDAAGNAFIAGLTYASLGGPSAGFVDAFLFKYDPAGNVLWSRQIGTSSIDFAYAVTVDALGNAYISGETSGSLGGPNAGGPDAFLTKYDGSGNLLWSQQIGSPGAEASLAVAVGSTGSVFIAGETDGSLGGPNAGATDAFLIKLSPVPEPTSSGLVAAALLSVSFRRSLRRHAVHRRPQTEID